MLPLNMGCLVNSWDLIDLQSGVGMGMGITCPPVAVQVPVPANDRIEDTSGQFGSLPTSNYQATAYLSTPVPVQPSVLFRVQ